MSRKFKIEKRYYDDDYELYKKGTITVEPGVTVLVGCNGSGKTTLLRAIREKLKAQKIPVMYFDNLNEGGANARSAAAFYQDFAFMSTSFCSSEGENIIMNLGRIASRLRPFIQTGDYDDDSISHAFARIMHGDEHIEPPKERWLLFDAIDSGLSVDNIVAVKEQLFKTVLEDRGDCEVYILVSANEYELARGEQCFDVYNGKYITFKDYEDYRKFILQSGDIKSRRYED